MYCMLVCMLRGVDGNAGVGDGANVGAVCECMGGSGVVSSADDVLEMIVG